MPHQFSTRRLRREAQTVAVMIRRYCRDRHGHHAELCPECAELLAYARKRLARCPFQENKTTCGKCPVHCYAPEKRERIQAVMRYSGPRMLLSHPIMALRHLLDGFRRPRRRG